jgi:hypothetical protein
MPQSVVEVLEQCQYGRVRKYVIVNKFPSIEHLILIPGAIFKMALHRE